MGIDVTILMKKSLFDEMLKYNYYYWATFTKTEELSKIKPLSYVRLSAIDENDVETGEIKVMYVKRIETNENVTKIVFANSESTVVSIDKEAVISQLEKDMGFSKEVAEIYADRIACMSYELQPVLDEWLKYNIIIEFVLNGVSIENIMEERQINFFEALFIMDTFIEEPTLVVGFIKSLAESANKKSKKQ